MSAPTAASSAARMTEDEAEQWRQRLRERSEVALHRRSERTAARQLAARRRAHGLIDRRAARLARGRTYAFEPDLDCTQ
ncbi:hypothetical protein [Actinoplanes auranticolor]|uniref:Uncharacterized protein n=1 Tax=Actinoplanes auranticolor TaxID=47988 RepID=A0A919SDD8_9ACTN|nr:hypothetical protein [Actinoplanes auranticolor]GIM69756.1 hypothetical protein Aau02nite_37590 [Actinoplanes auranticolor]